MLGRIINRGSPDRIFIVVCNASATTMTVGRGVVFDAGRAAANADGVNVTWKADATHHPGLLAGIVVQNAIEPSDYGLVQCFGQIDFYVAASMSGLDVDSLTNRRFFLSDGTVGGFTFDAVDATMATAATYMMGGGIGVWQLSTNNVAGTETATQQKWAGMIRAM